MKKRICIIMILVLCLTIIVSFSSCKDNSGKTTIPDKTAELLQNAGNGNKVYFAGPLFNQSEKDFNLKIVAVLEEFGYEVFLPQRDGIEAALLEGKTEDELVEMIFELDEGKVMESDILFMNLDGRVPDEGACVELGIAFGNGKRCYGFKTDTRSVELGMDLNPMIAGCMIKIFKNYDGNELVKEIREYLSSHQL